MLWAWITLTHSGDLVVSGPVIPSIAFARGNPGMLQRRTSPFFFTCEEKEGVKGCIGKAPQRVNARIRHMHREHSAYSNPTCAPRALFVWHICDSLFYLCRARRVRTHTPNERSGDNPSMSIQTLSQQHKLTSTITHVYNNVALP